MCEQMLSLCRKEPGQFRIILHKDEVHQEFLSEAETKRAELNRRLAKVENRRCKGVNETLEIS